jgi:hypothetical protein
VALFVTSNNMMDLNPKNKKHSAQDLTEEPAENF